ncbi:VWA domain-containing protein [Streptomyces californicus]
MACDLPLADRAWAEGGDGAPTPAPAPGAVSGPGTGEGRGLSAALRSRLTGRDGDDLWDRLVETGAPGSTPEALRRAALLTGWALRYEAEAGAGVGGTDLAREACMRGHLAEALESGRRPAVVAGALHTPPPLPTTGDPGTTERTDAPRRAAPGHRARTRPGRERRPPGPARAPDPAGGRLRRFGRAAVRRVHRSP